MQRFPRPDSVQSPAGPLPALARVRLANLAWIGLAAAVVVWFVALGSRPLFRPDEGRYAEIPREMLATGDWLVPHLNGLVYVEKPPLQYWLTATFFQAFGVQTWVARLITGLSAVFGILLIGWAARRLWGAGRAAIACGMCASAPLYFLIGQQLTLDMLFTFFLTAALAAFCIAQSVRDRPTQSLRWSLLCWAAIAGAIMTKGVAAIAIPGVTLLVYSLWQRDLKVWHPTHLILGLGLCLLLVAPWFVAVGRVVPGFTSFFFIHEHLMRFATLSARRFEPWWYFGPILLAGTAPWLPQILRAWRTRNSECIANGGFDVRRLLWTWAAVVLIFFSTSRSKLLPYVLPIVPVLALLVAGSRESTRERDARASAYITIAAAAVLAGGLIAFSILARDEKQHVLLRLIEPSVIANAVVLLLSGLAALWLFRHRDTWTGLTVVAAGWFASGALLIAWTAAAASPLYSSESMAEDIAARSPVPSHVYSVGYYEQTLPFYLGRTIDVVDFRGELDFGLSLDPSRALSRQQFDERWPTDREACAILSQSEYHRRVARNFPMTVVARDARYVLVTPP